MAAPIGTGILVSGRSSAAKIKIERDKKCRMPKEISVFTNPKSGSISIVINERVSAKSNNFTPLLTLLCESLQLIPQINMNAHEKNGCTGSKNLYAS